MFRRGFVVLLCISCRWGKYERALEELARGLELAGPEHSVTRVRLLTVRCSVAINTGVLDDAERDCQESLHIAQSIGARSEQASAYGKLGAVYGTQGQFERALEYHRQSLDIHREVGGNYQIVQALDNVGTALSYLGRLDEAEGVCQEALALHERIGDRHGEGYAYHSLAWLHLDQGRLDAAETDFLQALTLWEQIDFRKGLAFGHNDLGTLYLGQEQLDRAQVHLEESACRYEALGAPMYLPENYAALAQVYLGLEQLQQALAAAQKALDWARQNENRRQEASACCTLGQVYQAAADQAEVQRYARQALELAQAEPALADLVQAAEELLAESPV